VIGDWAWIPATVYTAYDTTSSVAGRSAGQSRQDSGSPLPLAYSVRNGTEGLEQVEGLCGGRIRTRCVRVGDGDRYRPPLPSWARGGPSRQRAVQHTVQRSETARLLALTRLAYPGRGRLRIRVRPGDVPNIGPAALPFRDKTPPDGCAASRAVGWWSYILTNVDVASPDPTATLLRVAGCFGGNTVAEHFTRSWR